MGGIEGAVYTETLTKLPAGAAPKAAAGAAAGGGLIARPDRSAGIQL